MVKSVFRAHDFEKDCCKEEVSTHLVCECTECIKKEGKKLEKTYLAWYFFMSVANLFALLFFAKISLWLFLGVWMFELALISYHGLIESYKKHQAFKKEN